MERLGSSLDDRKLNKMEIVNTPTVIANGKSVQIQLPGTVHDFLLEQKLLPRSVVVEHNGEALAPSQFALRELNAGD